MLDFTRLSRQIEASWDLADVKIVGEWVSCETRRVLHLTSSGGSYTAKLFHDLSVIKAQGGIEALLDVRQTGYVHAPQLLAARTGDYVTATPEGALVFMEYLPSPLDATESSDTWSDVGSALAALNTLPSRRAFAVPVPAALKDQPAHAKGTPFELGVSRLVAQLGHLGSPPSTGGHPRRGEPVERCEA